ncbi:hypothetical protein HanIR_Chr10g0453481 [Helianthus annuus]|nr:hypothetical protein HanIR_Chr10g0453481 [Helianthus annuus]
MWRIWMSCFFFLLVCVSGQFKYSSLGREMGLGGTMRRVLWNAFYEEDRSAVSSSLIFNNNYRFTTSQNARECKTVSNSTSVKSLLTTTNTEVMLLLIRRN